MTLNTVLSDRVLRAIKMPEENSWHTLTKPTLLALSALSLLAIGGIRLTNWIPYNAMTNAALVGCGAGVLTLNLLSAYLLQRRRERLDMLKATLKLCEKVFTPAEQEKIFLDERHCLQKATFEQTFQTKIHTHFSENERTALIEPASKLVTTEQRNLFLLGQLYEKTLSTY